MQLVVLAGFAPEANRCRAFVRVIEQQIFSMLRQLERRGEVPFRLIEHAWLEARAATQCHGTRVLILELRSIPARTHHALTHAQTIIFTVLQAAVREGDRQVQQ